MKHLIFLACLLIASIAHAEQPAALEGVTASTTAIQMNTKEQYSDSKLDKKLKLEIKLSHPDHKIFSLNQDKTVLKGLYSVRDPSVNLIEVMEENARNSTVHCFGSECGDGFVNFNEKDGDLYLTFATKNIELDQIGNMALDSFLYVNIVKPNTEAKDSLIKGATLSNGQQSLNNKDVGFTLQPSGGGSANGESYTSFKVESDSALSGLQILSPEGAELETFPIGTDKIVKIPQAHFDQTVDINVSYYETEERIIPLRQYFYQ